MEMSALEVGRVIFAILLLIIWAAFTAGAAFLMPQYVKDLLQMLGWVITICLALLGVHQAVSFIRRDILRLEKQIHYLQSQIQTLEDQMQDIT